MGLALNIENGQLVNAQGVGVANTRDRLKTLYENNYSFVLSHNTPSGLKVNLRVPFEKAVKK